MVARLTSTSGYNGKPGMEKQNKKKKKLGNKEEDIPYLLLVISFSGERFVVAKVSEAKRPD